MAAHDEDEEQDLSNTKDLSTDRPKQDFAGVGHTVYMGILLLELSNDISGVGGHDTETDEKDDTTRRECQWQGTMVD